jgi:hypothetical protein
MWQVAIYSLGFTRPLSPSLESSAKEDRVVERVDIRVRAPHRRRFNREIGTERAKLVRSKLMLRDPGSEVVSWGKEHPRATAGFVGNTLNDGVKIPRQSDTTVRATSQPLGNDDDHARNSIVDLEYALHCA